MLPRFYHKELWIMTENDKKHLEADNEGLANYEYLANHTADIGDDINLIISNLQRVDLGGQYLASAARYLNAIDAKGFAEPVRRMVALAIDRDREHRYIPDLIQSLYGEDYRDRAEQLSAEDNNFRRMYKRLYPESVI